jgi:phosphoribosylamine--glycine ligase
MKVMVVGGGGREHALAWKLAQSDAVDELLVAPGNAGTASVARNVSVKADDVKRLTLLARDEDVDLVVVGPELPLTLGLTDRLVAEGVAVFGPTADGARIEGSKWFAKQLMLDAGVPTGAAWRTSSYDEALSRAEDLGYPVVIKADGLAAGKGVVVAADRTEAEDAVRGALVEGRFGSAGSDVLVEEFLVGEEASVLAITDGERLAVLTPSQDHKRALEGDEGPNTGGMGAYAPAPVVTDAVLSEITSRVLEPTVTALRDRTGTPYRGVLYAGLMINEDGPRVVEFNCRFGDPETQPTMPLVDCDLAEVMLAASRGELEPESVRAADGAAACVVMASGGYPGAYEKGKVISGLGDAEAIEGVTVFHAGTRVDSGRVVTSGGRVLGVTAVAADLAAAIDRAYEGVKAISFEGAQFRRDIGHRALARLGRK